MCQVSIYKSIFFFLSAVHMICTLQNEVGPKLASFSLGFKDVVRIVTVLRLLRIRWDLRICIHWCLVAAMSIS